jgi:hypothetical protein
MDVVGEIPASLAIGVIVAAIVIGAIMIGAVIGKYVVNQWFHLLGGPILTGLGVALIGLSVYGNVELKIGDFEWKIRHLQAAVESRDAQIASLGESLTMAQTEVASLRQSANETVTYVTFDPELSDNTFLVNAVSDYWNALDNLDNNLTTSVEAWSSYQAVAETMDQNFETDGSSELDHSPPEGEAQESGGETDN